MRFTYNGRTYEVPEDLGISIEVVCKLDEADFNFVWFGEHLPMFGGTDERGERVPSWEEVGIRRVEG